MSTSSGSAGRSARPRSARRSAGAHSDGGAGPRARPASACERDTSSELRRHCAAPRVGVGLINRPYQDSCPAGEPECGRRWFCCAGAEAHKMTRCLFLRSAARPREILPGTMTRTPEGSATVCVVGIDFGTDSVRSIVADATTGARARHVGEALPAVGQGAVLRSGREPVPPAPARLPREHGSVGASRRSREAGARRAARVRGIAVDTTGSTPVLADRAGKPLALSAPSPRTRTRCSSSGRTTPPSPRPSG